VKEDGERLNPIILNRSDGEAKEWLAKSGRVITKDFRTKLLLDLFFLSRFLGVVFPFKAPPRH
jgi:hypothetical protein